MKRLISLLLCLAALLALPACGRIAGEESSSGGVVPEDPFAGAPYGVRGLTLYQGEEAERGTGVTLLARLANDAQTAEGYFSLKSLYDLGEGKLVLDYAISDRQIQFFDGEPEGITEAKQQNYLVTYDPELGQTGKTVALPVVGGSAYTYLSQNGGLLWSWTTGSIRSTAIGYDGELNQVNSFTVDGDLYGSFTEDGAYYYTVEDQILRRYSTADDAPPPEDIALKQHFAVDTLVGLHRDGDGEDYAIVTGRAGDLQDYRGMIKLSTGEFVYLQGQDTAYFYQDGPALLCQDWDDASGSAYVVSVGAVPYRYVSRGETYVSLGVLSNGNLLFYCVEEPDEETEDGTVSLHLWLYDGATGEQLSSAVFPMEGSSYYWMYGTPFVCADGESLILALASHEQCTYYYRWHFAESGAGEEGLTVEQAGLKQPVAEVTDRWDPTSFRPGECPQALSDLRSRADWLENRYDVKIYLSKECSNIIGGYAIEALSDHRQVEEALDLIEEGLSRYPAHFFNQLEWDWSSGLDIYITGQLIGVSSGNLDFAGGFQTSYNGRQLIALDCTNLDAVSTNLHHEISHAIDAKLEGLDQTQWDALNPSQYGDCYTYSYERFGRSELMGCTYYGCDSLSEVYFVDDYSMTFPTEDRARLFENIMVDESEQYIDWDSCPHLREKLNYYAACIRAEFDTTGWENVPWERYLDLDALTDGAA